MNENGILDAPVTEILSECTNRGRFDYFQAFEKCLNSTSKDELTENELRATKLLRAICGIPLPFNEAKLRFVPGNWYDYENNQVFSAKDISESDAILLHEFAIKQHDIILRSIIMDFLWTTKYTKRLSCVKEAIELYFQYPTIGNLGFGVEPLGIMRALDLSYSLYGGKEKADEATSLGLEYIVNTQPENFNHLHIQILRILPPSEMTASATFHAQLLSTAQYLFDHRQFMIYREVLQHLLLLMRPDENMDRAQKAEIEEKISESFIHESDDVWNPLAKAFILGQAVESFRQYGNHKKEKETHIKLLAIQKGAEKQWFSIMTGPENLSEIIVEVEQFIKSDDLRISLLRMAQLDEVIDLDAMLELGRKDVDDYPLFGVFEHQFFDASGKRIGIPAILTEGYDSKIEHAMTLRIEQHIGVFVRAILLPAIHHILMQHGNILSLSHFDALVFHHHFVRPGFERFYSRGLLAGFEMDYAVANSLLVPQLENSLRYLMDKLDEIPSTYIDGIQKEKVLEKALTNQKIQDYLGENLCKVLLRLLIDPRLGSQRHSLAHGFKPYNNFWAETSIYTWWVAFKLIMSPIISGRNAPDGQDRKIE